VPGPAEPAREPDLLVSRRPQRAITYRDDGNGTVSWIDAVTVAGELITHASDNGGDINRQDVQVSPGPNMFTAPEPLSQIDDIGGVLYIGSALTHA
jgi:hypothetical protein